MRVTSLVLAFSACSPDPPPPPKPDLIAAVCRVADRALDSAASAGVLSAEPLGLPEREDEQLRCRLLAAAVDAIVGGAEAVDYFVAALGDQRIDIKPTEAVRDELRHVALAIRWDLIMGTPDHVGPRDMPCATVTVGATAHAVERVLEAIGRGRKSLTAKGCP